MRVRDASLPRDLFFRIHLILEEETKAQRGQAACLPKDTQLGQGELVGELGQCESHDLDESLALSQDSCKKAAPGCGGYQRGPSTTVPMTLLLRV